MNESASYQSIVSSQPDPRPERQETALETTLNAEQYVVTNTAQATYQHGVLSRKERRCCYFAPGVDDLAGRF